MDEIFLKQIGKTFDDMMKGKKNNPANRCGVYAELTRMFPEGIFKGFTYPNISAGEEYTLRVLSGKRGETGSISVLETSDSNSSGRGEIDLGSGADTEDEDKDYEESAVIPEEKPTFPLYLKLVHFVPPEPHPKQPGRRTAAGRNWCFPEKHPPQKKEPETCQPGSTRVHLSERASLPANVSGQDSGHFSREHNRQ